VVQKGDIGMRKAAAVLLVFLLVFSSLSGCGIKKKISNKLSEKLMENVLEQALGGGDADIDFDGGKISIKGKEGESLVIGADKWPDINFIPEFKKGKIVSSLYDDKTAVIIIEEVKQKDFEDYLKKIKNDFPEDGNNFDSEGYIFYEGKNSRGDTISVKYEVSGESLMISAAKNGG